MPILSLSLRKDGNRNYRHAQPCWCFDIVSTKRDVTEHEFQSCRKKQKRYFLAPQARAQRSGARNKSPASHASTPFREGSTALHDQNSLTHGFRAWLNNHLLRTAMWERTHVSVELPDSAWLEPAAPGSFDLRSSRLAGTCAALRKTGVGHFCKLRHQGNYDFPCNSEQNTI